MKLCWDNQLDIQVILGDGVVDRRLHSLAKRGILVYQGKSERPLCREIIFFVYCRADHLINEPGGILPVLSVVGQWWKTQLVSISVRWVMMGLDAPVTM